MAVKAIDIALIPSDEVIDYCLNINKRAKDLDKAFFELGKEDFIPHISLALGCVDEKDIAFISNKLNEILEDKTEIDLDISGFGKYAQKDGSYTLYLDIVISDILRSFHEKAIEIVRPFLVESKDALVLVEGEETSISEGSMKILNNYIESYAYENFHPHISLGVFDFEEKEEFTKTPLKFKVSKLSLFHVGNRCTCRRETSSVNLN
ncbi:hypothetical protein CL619_03345 [archaeon]|mgnify:CR=1 FL=1|nr:hypothetical protein [archaeon]|tara:strand:- start:3369 stop:3989 length:621 start_codon:yes stop_codon:yes gene_type:complete